MLAEAALAFRSKTMIAAAGGISAKALQSYLEYHTDFARKYFLARYVGLTAELDALDGDIELLEKRAARRDNNEVRIEMTKMRKEPAPVAEGSTDAYLSMEVLPC